MMCRKIRVEKKQSAKMTFERREGTRIVKERMKVGSWRMINKEKRKRRRKTDFHCGAEREYMRPRSSNSHFYDDNVYKMVYPTGKEREMFAVVNCTDKQVTTSHEHE